MNKPAQAVKKSKPIHAGSTQKFTEIQDIVENIVILENGAACLVTEIQATNFALLSPEEQAAKISSYASLLNSLSFPIQILIRNKKIDISSYINLLSQECEKTSILHRHLSQEQNQALITQIKLYRDFVQELIKQNSVLDKKFYIIIPFSYLEKGAVATASMAKKGANDKENFILSAKAALHTKADSLHAQLARLALKAKTLDNEELVKLFYDIYNQDQAVSSGLSTGVNTLAIKTVPKI